MPMNSITDIVTAVAVSKSEYKDLVRSDEVIVILKRMFRHHKYVDGDTVREILNVEYEEGTENGGE